MEVRVTQDNPNDEQLVEGYAVRFDEPTVMYEYGGTKYYEVIDRNALNDTDLKDVPFKYNHSDNVMIMARTRNKTLELKKDSKGLFIKANLAPTTSGKDLYQLIKRGDIDKMSFAFTISEDSYDRETHTRKILKIKKLWDVAAVDTPAYSTTSISARAKNFFELENKKEALEREKRDKKRKKLLIKTYL